MLAVEVLESPTAVESNGEQGLRRLVANVAHDLKTPLSALTNGNELILNIVNELKISLLQNPKAQSDIVRDLEFVESTLESTLNMGHFMRMSINRCMEFSQMQENSKLKPLSGTVNLAEALHLPVSCIESVDPNQIVEVEALPEQMCSHVITDVQWLQENTLCLLSNAVKFSNHNKIVLRLLLKKTMDVCEDFKVKGPPAAVSFRTPLSTPSPEDKLIVLECEDSGIGLSEEAMANLFAPFKQAQRLVGGTGLGLFSLANRMEALRGLCGVRPRRDGRQGCRFWFAFPYKPDEMAAQEAALESKIVLEAGTREVDSSAYTECGRADRHRALRHSFSSVVAKRDKDKTTATTVILPRLQNTESATTSTPYSEPRFTETKASLTMSGPLIPICHKVFQEIQKNSGNTILGDADFPDSRGGSFVQDVPAVPVLSLQPLCIRGNNNNNSSRSDASPNDASSGNLDSPPASVPSSAAATPMRTPSPLPVAAVVIPSMPDVRTSPRIQHMHRKVTVSTAVNTTSPTVPTLTCASVAAATTNGQASPRVDRELTTPGSTARSGVTEPESPLITPRPGKIHSSPAVPARCHALTGEVLSILLVDDTPLIIRITTGILQRAGYEVTIAGNGFEALRILQQRDFDLVLMDLQMPVLDGLETVRRVREAESSDSVPKKHQFIVAVSANSDPTIIQDCLDMGFDAYIEKPFNMAQFDHVVQEYSTVLTSQQRRYSALGFA